MPDAPRAAQTRDTPQASTNSTANTDTTAAATLPATKWTPTSTEQRELDALDALLARMRACTPSDPYVNTIPQEVEPRYHHPTAHHVGSGAAAAARAAWRRGTPFQPDDHEAVQYATFLFHEPGEACFVQQPSQKTSLGGTGFGASYTSHGGHAGAGLGGKAPGVAAAPKKKITLDTYKKKQAGVLTTTTTPNSPASRPTTATISTSATSSGKPLAVKSPAERVRSEKEDILSAVAEAEGIAVQDFEAPSSMAPVAVGAVKAVHPVGADGLLKRKREGKEEVQEQGQPRSDGKVAKEARVDTPTVDNKDVPATKKARQQGDAISLVQAKDGSSEATKEANGIEVKATRPGSGASASPDTALPPRLSPVMPAKLSPLARPSKEPDAHLESIPPLPARVSPRLPPSVLRTLGAKRHFDAASRSPHLRPPASLTTRDRNGTLVSPSGATKNSPRSVPRNGFRANSSSPAVRSDVEDAAKALSALKHTHGKGHELPVRDKEAAERKVTKMKSAEKLMIKLKYKKSRREDVQRILKMRPRPAKMAAALFATDSAVEAARKDEQTGKRIAPAKTDKEDAPIKGIAQRVEPVQRRKRVSNEKHASVGAGKRPPSAQDDLKEPVAKRRRSVSSDEKQQEPSTPSNLDRSSPEDSLGHKRSHLQATPTSRKGLLAVAMQREQSQDSLAMQTPPALRTPNSGPSQPGPNGAVRPPSSQPSNKTPQQQAWETEQARLTKLGRELKHAATAQLESANRTRNADGRRVAAAAALESFLCFILAFTAGDAAAAAAAHPHKHPSALNWDSLRGFYVWVKRGTQPFAPLRGLACALGVVFSARALQIIALRPVDAARDFRDLAGGKDSAREAFALHTLMQDAARDAEGLLDVDALQAAFPASWAARTKGPLPPEAETLEPVRFGGPFKLPISLASSPVCAARAGLAMLGEWVRREGVEYVFKLKI